MTFYTYSIYVVETMMDITADPQLESGQDEETDIDIETVRNYDDEEDE